MIGARSLKAACLSLALATPASAIDLFSLRAELDTGATEDFAYIRCAGFYLSVLSFTGEEQLGAETAKQTRDTVEKMVRRADGLRDDLDQGAVIKNVLEVSNAYLERYKSNLEASGNAFTHDEMWLSDSEICAIARDDLMQ